MSQIKVAPFSEKETSRMKQSYRDPFCKHGQRYVRTEPGNFVLPIAYDKLKNYFAALDVRSDDLFVVTFPKSGTTWTLELVWNLINNVDVDQARVISINKRVPFIESPVLDLPEDGILPTVEQDVKQLVDTASSPRVFKTHLPFSLLPPDLLDKCKVVSCLRNPKDTIVSFYHHEKLFPCHGYTGDFATFFDLFMDGLVLYSPYFKQVAEIWERRHHPNMCILFYEDMKEDLTAAIEKVSAFLGKDLTKLETLRLLDHLGFDKMKENTAVNYSRRKELTNREGRFMRKGQVGDWKNYFTPEMNMRLEAAIENHFQPIGLNFRWE